MAEERRPLRDLVDRLCAAQHDDFSRSPADARPLPSRATLIRVLDELRAALFPGYFGDREFDEDGLHFHVGATLDRVRRELEEQVRRGLCSACDAPDPERCRDCDARATAATDTFFDRLPEIRRVLGTDAMAAYHGDPAATSPAETILCYPGILAITIYRLAHELYRVGVPIVPRLMTEHAHGVTGIDIHPGTTIGEHFFIDHGTGVVIGETAVIGNRVRIYQGVTLGARSFPLDVHGHPIKGQPRHPIVEDDVIIYSGATILGRVTIGAGAVIGGNVWVTENVPPNGRVSQGAPRGGEFIGGAGI